MPIVDVKRWGEFVRKNKDPYGKACVDVAQRAVELIDEQTEGTPLPGHGLICRADKEMRPVSGITGFMADCIIGMISKCHSRGDEFRKSCEARRTGNKAKERRPARWREIK